MRILIFAVLFIIARIIDAWIRGRRYKQKFEREAREVEEKCAGKPLEEQLRIHRAYRAKLEAEVRRLRGAGEPQKEPGRGKTRLSGTEAVLPFAAGVIAANMMNDPSGGTGGAPDAAGPPVGCDCCDGGGDCGCGCG